MGSSSGSDSEDSKKGKYKKSKKDKKDKDKKGKTHKHEDIDHAQSSGPHIIQVQRLPAHAANHPPLPTGIQLLPPPVRPGLQCLPAVAGPASYAHMQAAPSAFPEAAPYAFPEVAPAPHSNIPPSGYRIPLSTSQPFPPADQAGSPVCPDADGTPVFIGSALLDGSVHPCKITPLHGSACLVPLGGSEHHHYGRYDLLPFTPDTMVWIRTGYGQIPAGHRPIEGGYEAGGNLYHSMAFVNGIRVPGKCGAHLGGCNVPYGGAEHVVVQDYEILCWR